MKQRIVNWIKKQVKEAGAKGIVLGLSGGVDSALVASLAKCAVGKTNLLALLMPCHSHSGDLEDAKLVARKLGIKIKVINLSELYDDLKSVLPQANAKASANIKPRLRMLILYYFANKFNYLVCGTGNKSEAMVGYFTKYGDGAVDILPIGGLFKRQVKELAKEMKIPEKIISKAPSAGLWHGQTDEAEMGITYEELDNILERFENGKKQIFAKSKVDRVKKMIKRSKHKRQAPEICRV